MSVKIMGLVWDAELKRDLKYVLLAYADHADHDGQRIYPSVGLIAWKTGYSVRQVQRYTQELIGLKILTLKGSSHLGTNEYKINVSALEERSAYDPKGVLGKRGRPKKMGDVGDTVLNTPINGDAHDTVLVTADTKNGDILAKNGDILAKNGDIAMSYKPSFKPSLKPSKEHSGAEKRSAAKRQGDVMDGILKYANPGRPDLADYPEDVRPVIALYCEQYGQNPPPKVIRKGSEFGLWIQDARLLMQAGGEKTLDVLASLKEKPYEWMATAMIGRPGALIKAVRARSGELKTEGQGYTGGWTEDSKEAARQRIREWKAQQSEAGV